MHSSGERNAVQSRTNNTYNLCDRNIIVAKVEKKGTLILDAALLCSEEIKPVVLALIKLICMFEGISTLVNLSAHVDQSISQ